MEQKETFVSKYWGWLITATLGVALVAPLAFGVTVFKGAADDKQALAVQAGVLAALKPICVDQAANDPLYDVRVAELSAETSSSKRSTAFGEFDWAVLPGQEKASAKAKRDLAAACLQGVIDAYKAEAN